MALTDIKNRLLVKTISLTSAIFKGLGQIMLQENPFTGFIFLIGIFYGSCIMGAAALLATVCGTATALLLNYNKSEISKGLYGFSAALVGVALMLFLKPVLLSWVFVILGASLSTIIQHFFIKRKIPVFTLPFVLVTWLILFFTNTYIAGTATEPPATINSITNFITFGWMGYGQVIFQDSLVSGILFFIAVFISSPISALYGLAAAILSALLAFKLSVPINDLSIGLYSYNAVLCAIVFSGTQIKNSIWILTSVLLSLAISLSMWQFTVPPLTFPFVLASCITLFLKSKLTSVKKQKEQ